MSANLDDAIADYKKRKAAGKTKRKLRESDIEKYGCEVVKGIDGIPYKFVSPSRRSVPDRLKLLPIPPEHRELVSRYVRFVEYKAPGVEASESQKREHETLRELGYYVTVIDSKEGVDNEFLNLFYERNISNGSQQENPSEEGTSASRNATSSTSRRAKRKPVRAKRKPVRAND